MKQQAYAVIIAGGKGTRFWPLSRPRRPKQLLKIVSGRSLIQETVDRILPLFGPKKTLVVTVAEHFSPIRKELSMLPKGNFLIEPQGNNTAPCIGLAALELAARNPNAIMIILPADHWISRPNSFYRTVKRAVQLAEERDALVTIGIRPVYPETGYGYILKGKKITGARGTGCHRVKGFKEKPTRKEASHLIVLGSLWNSGIFVWKVSTILAMLRRFSPSIYDGLRRIQEAARGRGLANPPATIQSILRREYRKMPNISIDYAVLEKAGAEGRALTLEADFGWNDVGNWAAVHRMQRKDGSGNAGMGKWLGVQSRDCLVYSPHRLAALLGVQSIVVVDTPDAVLVADMKRAQEVKDLVETLRRKGYRRYNR